jgi:uncharacterized protein with HEPN domain
VPRRDWRLRVHDILKAVERIEKFTRGLTLEKFIEDDRTIAAVSYELVVIGEAARKVPNAVQGTAPDVPWRVMSDMRNVVAHGYFGVDLSIVWQTAIQDVPKLGPPLRRLLALE